MLANLLLYFFELLNLRRSASELPRSTLLLSCLLGADVLTSTMVGVLFGSADALLKSLLSDGLLCLGVFGVLLLRSRATRCLQTLSAMFGAGALISVFALFLGVLYSSLSPIPPQGALMVFFQLLLFCLMLWTLAVFTHLLREAADWPTLAAALAVLALQGAISLSLKFLLQGN